MIVIEQLIFNILAFALFIIIFSKIVKKNDTSYVISIIIEAIGITINFVQLIANAELPMLLKIIAYIMAIFLPLAIIALEKTGLLFSETVAVIKAKTLLIVKDNKNAKKALIKLLTKNPSSYIGHKMLAEIYEAEGGMRKAIDEYVKVIDIQNNDYTSYYKIADLLNNLDKKDEAAQMLNNLLKKNPENCEATKLLGDILIEQGKYKEAAYVYNDALKYFPTDYDLNYSLGIVYTMLSDFQNAKIYYEKASTLNSLECNSKYSLAEIALIYKELEEAEQYFLQSCQDPELEADAYYELAKINLIKGEKEKAIQYANTALESDPVKIAEKIKNDNSFIAILPKLTIPLNLENLEEKECNLSKKFKKAKEQLEKTSEIAQNIGYDDIRLLEYKKNKDAGKPLKLESEINLEKQEAKNLQQEEVINLEQEEAIRRGQRVQQYIDLEEFKLEINETDDIESQREIEE